MDDKLVPDDDYWGKIPKCSLLQSKEVQGVGTVLAKRALGTGLPSNTHPTCQRNAGWRSCLVWNSDVFLQDIYL